MQTERTHDEKAAGEVEGVFPCSATQERCWFIDTLNPGNPALNVALRWEVRGRFSAETLERAFQAVIARHEVLRTRFVEAEGGPRQEVLAHAPFRLAQIDLTARPPQSRMDAAMEIGRSEARAPFDLSAAPLLRATLVRLDVDHAVLLVTAHQIVFDGFSIKILGGEIGRIAAALDAGASPGLPELHLQYADYVLWQRAFLDSDGFRDELSHWVETLRGARALALPCDRPRPATPGYRGEILAATLTPAQGAALEAAARAAGVSLFAYGLASAAALLHGFSGVDDLVLGTQIAGREEPELEAMIGVFINNLPLRIKTDGAQTFNALVARASEAVQAAMVHQRLPYHHLVQALNPPRDNGRNPLISVNYTLLHEVIEHGRYGDFVLEGKPSFAAGALYDLNFFIVRWPDGWRLAIEYDPDLFEPDTAKALLEGWRRIIVEASVEPRAELAGLTEWRGPRHGAAEVLPPDDLVRALRSDPSVADAEVIVRDGRLHGYVAPSPDFDAALEDLPRRLRLRLAEVFGERAGECTISVLLRLPRRSDGRLDPARLPTPAAAPPPLAPAGPTDLAIALRALWRELLATPDLDWADDFFRSGGHSLLALRLVAGVEKLTGVRPPVTALFKAPTLQAYAALVAGLLQIQAAPASHAPAGEEDQAARIVHFRQDGARLPLIALNNTMLYTGLAAALGPDRPVSAINLFDIEHPHDLPDRPLQDIAADYVSLLRKARPNGPYVLIGLCAAGAVAFEVAQQLRAAGEQAPAIIIADCWRPGWRGSQPRWRRLLIALDQKLRRAFGRFSRLLRGELSFVDFLGTFGAVRRSRLLEAAVALNWLRAVPPEEDAQNRWFLGHLIAARDAYAPKPFDGTLIVLASAQVPTGPLYDPKMGWEGFAERLLFQAVPGGHLDMFDRPETQALLRGLLDSFDA